MGWSGGNYTKGNNSTGGWVGDASLGIGIEAGRHDTQDNDFATGINQCLNKDGSNAATGPLNAGGFKLTNVADGTATTDVTTFRQVQAGINTSGTALSTSATRFSNDTSGAAVTYQKSRGATVGTNTIVQNGDSLGEIYFAGATGSAYQSGAAIVAFVDGVPGATNDMPGRLSFRTTADGAGSTTERMVIKATGNVGIGLSDPSWPLEVQAASSNAVAINARGRSADGIGVLLFTDNALAEVARLQTSTGSLSINKTGNNPILFATNGVEQARIQGSGNVGIGNTGPDAKLVVQTNTSQVTARVQSNFSGDLTAHALIVGKYDNNFTPSQRFIGFTHNQTLNGNGQINANGSGQAGFGSFSDERLKENISNLPSQLANILAIRPVEFDYKDGSGHQIGFIAQEIQAIYPDVVGESDGYLTLTDMNKNDARLIKAFQELYDKVKALEEKVELLEA